MLQNNGLYCAFIEVIFDKSLFHFYVLFNTCFLPVARKNHPLEGREVSLADIHSFPLILKEKGSGTREIYENYLYEHNDSLRSASKIYEICSFGIMKSVIKNSNAILFIFEEVAKKEVQKGELCYLTIEEFSIKRPLYFIYPSNSLMKKRIELFYNRLTQG